MKRWILVGILLGVLLLGAFVGETCASQATAQEKTMIICTTSVLGDFVREIGEERIEVKTIAPAGYCPSHYDMKPSDVYAVSKAKFVFFHGIEPWLDNLDNIIRTSGNEEVQKVQVKGEWDSPASKIEKIELIKGILAEYEPDNASYFEENAAHIITLINETANGLKEKADHLKVDQIKVMCIKWQEGFVKWLGFNVIATYMSPETLSLKQTLELVQKGKEENVALIIDNLQSGTDFGAKLASEVGATQVILSNFPGAVPETESHIKLIEYNAKQLLDTVKEKTT